MESLKSTQDDVGLMPESKTWESGKLLAKNFCTSTEKFVGPRKNYLTGGTMTEYLSTKILICPLKYEIFPPVLC